MLHTRKQTEFFGIALNNLPSYQLINESGISVPISEHGLHDLIKKMENYEGCRFQYVELVFLNDKEMLQMNRKFLSHNYLTDILTFPYHEMHSELLEGSLFCCVQQIQRQSAYYQVSFESELTRVVIHGLLHLIGYDDNNSTNRQSMHKLENKYLSILSGL